MHVLTVFILFLLISALLAPSGFAQVMQQEEYILRLDSYSQPTTPLPSSTERNSTEDLKSLPPATKTPQLSQSLNLSVTPGFLDFGIVHATNPVNRLIEISSTTLPGFLLYIFENRNLQAETSEIPQASCDSGTCSQSMAGEWNSTLSFGLGYSCASEGCDQDFRENHFRPLTLTPTAFAKPDEDQFGLKNTKIPLRLNTSATQTPGSYQNSIIILAVPEL